MNMEKKATRTMPANESTWLEFFGLLVFIGQKIQGKLWPKEKFLFLLIKK